MSLNIFNILASCFGIGYAPKMPGTIASVATTLLLFFRPLVALSTDFFVLLLLLPISIFICHQADKASTCHDAGWIVLDEFVGMYLALVCLPRTWWLYLVALVLFRIFDIAKPFPIGMIERRYANGFGIVLDDVIAGLFTLVILYALTALYL